MMSLFTAW